MQDVAATFVVTGLVLLPLSEILVYVWVVAEQVVQQHVVTHDSNLGALATQADVIIGSRFNGTLTDPQLLDRSLAG
jgi:hypothetical protein